jgi:hypothetical protein
MRARIVERPAGGDDTRNRRTLVARLAGRS